jgi:hypothetical protein
MSLFPETPKLESRNCPEIVPGGVPGLWELITPDCEVWLRRGLNQTCSPRRDLFNDVSQSQFGGQEEVDSWLLVVGSQTASLTPGPSFAHNLGYRCSNDQCEAIFYIYSSRPFQWHQEHLNARCFGPCCRALNIRESRRIPNPHFFQVLGFTPTLGQSRVATEDEKTLLVLPCLGHIFGSMLQFFVFISTCESWQPILNNSEGLSNGCWMLETVDFPPLQEKKVSIQIGSKFHPIWGY